MTDKLILNANMICKSSGFKPQKCTVEKVIEVSGAEFQHFIEAPTLRNYYLPQYKKLMGYYDNSYHGVLFVNMENGDGLLVNSEGYDYARYSQYIPNALGLICQHDQTAALDNLKTHMDACIDKWLEQNENEDKFGIPLTDIIEESNFAEALVEHVSEKLYSDPRIEACELTPNTLEVTKRELVETRLYCPLKIEINDGSEYPEEVCSENYVGYDDEINDFIRNDLNRDTNAVERGLAAYFYDKNLDKKVFSIMPIVETRNGNLYGVAVVNSYGELDKVEAVNLVGYITGQFSDGYGESLEQRPITLGEDEVYISFWNSDGDYFLKPENEVFHTQNFEQTMGGI